MSGLPERPSFVYLPGLDGSGDLLYYQEPELAGKFRVVRIRFRDRGPFDMQVLLADLEQRLADEGVERFWLCGESFGSSVAISYALAQPDRVERLVIVNGFAYLPRRALLVGGYLLARSLSRAVARLLRTTVAVPIMAVDGIPRDRRARFLDVAARQDLDGYAWRLKVLRDFDVRGQLQRLSMPVLFLAGTLDKVVPPACSWVLAQSVKAATLRMLDGVGHAALLSPAVSLCRICTDWAAESERVGQGSEDSAATAPNLAGSAATAAGCPDRTRDRYEC